MGSIPAGNIRMGTRRAKTGRQTYVSLLTYMDVFLFYKATPMTEDAKRSMCSISCSDFTFKGVRKLSEKVMDIKNLPENPLTMKKNFIQKK